LRCGEVFNVEARFLGADGDYKWFLAKALPLTKDGSIVNLKRTKPGDGDGNGGPTNRRRSHTGPIEEDAFEIEEWFGTLTDILILEITVILI
jgi:hypothetical protein